MTALHDLSATDLVAAYARRELSPVEVTTAVLAVYCLGRYRLTPTVVATVSTSVSSATGKGYGAMARGWHTVWAASQTRTPPATRARANCR